MSHYGESTKLNRVDGGERVSIQCGVCKKKTMYYECRPAEGQQDPFAKEIWKMFSHALQCEECLGVCDYDEIFPGKKAEEELKFKQHVEEKRREDERRKNEQDIEDELAQLKKKLGK